jgi:glycerol-3-phosphate dehydrogenase
LVSVTGGKWTTYRAMAQEVLQKCVAASLVPERGPAKTESLRLVGAAEGAGAQLAISAPEGLHSYGSEQVLLDALPGAQNWLTPSLSEAMVRFAARFEYAVRVEDVLARRSRLLFLDARLAAQIAHEVGELLWSETGIDPDVPDFLKLAAQYTLD